MSLVLSFLLALLVAASVDAQATACKQDYGSLAEAMADVDMGSYPTAQFNKECLSKDCDNLKSIPCPFNDGSKTEYNTATINDILVPETLKCLNSATSLCGVPVNNIPFCNFGVTLQGLLPTSGLEGKVAVKMGTITGIPDAKISYDGSNHNGNINVTLVYKGTLQVTTKSMNYDDIPLTITTPINVVIHVNSTNAETPVTVVSDTIKNTFDVDTSKITDDSDDFATKFKKAIADISGSQLNTPIAKDVGRFYGYIFANVCLLSQDKCMA